MHTFHFTHSLFNRFTTLSIERQHRRQRAFCILSLGAGWFVSGDAYIGKLIITIVVIIIIIIIVVIVNYRNDIEMSLLPLLS